MTVTALTFNNFQVNTYIVGDDNTKKCAIVDPGMMDTNEMFQVIRTLDKHRYTPEHLINTHQHIDHVIGNHFINQLYKLSPEANCLDDFLGSRVQEQAEMFGLKADAIRVPVITYLEDGDRIRIGDSSLRVIAVPGHSPGSIALYSKEGGFVITGDALFSGSIGRTDLPGGDFDTLIRSIKTKLFTLPDDTIVLPGHGPSSTIRDEKRLNPYLR